ncbi:Protein T24C4.2, partial [Aphelenchoides avenae]
IGKRPNQNYLPCGCKAMLRLNFNYADNALRITTLNDVHTGHEVSPESFARISAKCRRLSPGSGGSGGASPSPMSGASSWASSKSTNPSPRSAFMPSRAHTHSGSEKTSPASLSDTEKGSLGEHEHVAEYKPPSFNGPPLMQNLKDELLRTYLRMTLGGFGDISSAFQPRGLPAQLSMADQQRLMESQQRYMSSNGIYPNPHSGGARNGLSAAALGLLELQQRHMNPNSIFPNVHGGNVQAQSPAQNLDAASSMKALTDLLAMQASRATHAAQQEKLSSVDAKNPLNELCNGLDLSVKASTPGADSLGGIRLEPNARGGASQAKIATEKWPYVMSAPPSTITKIEAQSPKTSNTTAGTTLREEITGSEPPTKGVGNLHDFRELISQISKIPNDGTNSELVRYFKRQTQAFMLSKLVKRWGSTDLFLSPEFQNFVLSLAPDFQLPSAEELNAVLNKKFTHTGSSNTFPLSRPAHL